MIHDDVGLLANTGRRFSVFGVIAQTHFNLAAAHSFNSVRCSDKQIAQQQIIQHTSSAAHIQHCSNAQLFPVFRRHILFRMVICNWLALCACNGFFGKHIVSFAFNLYHTIMTRFDGCFIRAVQHGSDTSKRHIFAQQKPFRRKTLLRPKFFGSVKSAAHDTVSVCVVCA